MITLHFVLELSLHEKRVDNPTKSVEIYLELLINFVDYDKPAALSSEVIASASGSVALVAVVVGAAVFIFHRHRLHQQNRRGNKPESLPVHHISW